MNANQDVWWNLANALIMREYYTDRFQTELKNFILITNIANFIKKLSSVLYTDKAIKVKHDRICTNFMADKGYKNCRVKRRFQVTVRVKKSRTL